MNRIVAIIAGLHVLAHSVFGCCGHDSHNLRKGASNSAVLQCCDSTGSPFPNSHERHGCGHHFAGADQNLDVAHTQAICSLCESESSRHQSHQCSHGSCQWLASKPFDASTLVALNLSLIFCTSTDAPATFATATVCALESEQRQTLALPLRLHLALGVLLI